MLKYEIMKKIVENKFKRGLQTIYSSVLKEWSSYAKIDQLWTSIYLKLFEIEKVTFGKNKSFLDFYLLCNRFCVKI